MTRKTEERIVGIGLFIVTVLVIFAWAQLANGQSLDAVKVKRQLLAPQSIAVKPVEPRDRTSFRPFGPMTFAATAFCIGGQAADIATSQRGYETNDFLRKADGSASNAKMIPIKLGVCLMPLFFEKHTRRDQRIAFRVAQFAWGGISLAAAIHNSRY